MAKSRTAPPKPARRRGAAGTKARRFDAKLSAEQKAFFEKAAEIGQYRSLSDFVLKAAQEKAEEVIARHESLFSSARDRQAFFEALTKPPAPNPKLRAALGDYLSLTLSARP